MLHEHKYAMSWLRLRTCVGSIGCDGCGERKGENQDHEKKEMAKEELS